MNFLQDNILCYYYITVSWVKARLYFVSSSFMFLDKKTLLEIWRNLGLNLTIFRGTGPSTFGFDS